MPVARENPRVARRPARKPRPAPAPNFPTYVPKRAGAIARPKPRPAPVRKGPPTPPPRWVRAPTRAPSPAPRAKARSRPKPAAAPNFPRFVPKRPGVIPERGPSKQAIARARHQQRDYHRQAGAVRRAAFIQKDLGPGEAVKHQKVLRQSHVEALRRKRTTQSRLQERGYVSQGRAVAKHEPVKSPAERKVERKYPELFLDEKKSKQAGFAPPGLGEAIASAPKYGLKELAYGLQDASDIGTGIVPSTAHLVHTAVTKPQKLPGELLSPYAELGKNVIKGPKGWEEIAKHPVSTALMVQPFVKLPKLARGRIARGEGTTAAALRKATGTKKQTLARPPATLKGTTLVEQRTGDRRYGKRRKQEREDAANPNPQIETTQRFIKRPSVRLQAPSLKEPTKMVRVGMVPVKVKGKAARDVAKATPRPTRRSHPDYVERKAAKAERKALIGESKKGVRLGTTQLDRLVDEFRDASQQHLADAAHAGARQAYEATSRPTRKTHPVKAERKAAKRERAEAIEEKRSKAISGAVTDVKVEQAKTFGAPHYLEEAPKTSKELTAAQSRLRRVKSAHVQQVEAEPLGAAYRRIRDKETGAKLANVKAGGSGDKLVVGADIVLGGEKIGRVSRYYDPKTGTLVKESTKIDPAHQKKGIASRLALEEEKAVARVGGQRVEVVPGSEAGMALSARLGFTGARAPKKTEAKPKTVEDYAKELSVERTDGGGYQVHGPNRARAGARSGYIHPEQESLRTKTFKSQAAAEKELAKIAEALHKEGRQMPGWPEPGKTPVADVLRSLSDLRRHPDRKVAKLAKEIGDNLALFNRKPSAGDYGAELTRAEDFVASAAKPQLGTRLSKPLPQVRPSNAKAPKPSERLLELRQKRREAGAEIRAERQRLAEAERKVVEPEGLPEGSGRIYSTPREANVISKHLGDDFKVMVIENSRTGKNQYAVIPKAVADRMAEHGRVGKGGYTVGPVLRVSMEMFRRAVLPLSVRWLVGQATEAGIRAAAMGAGPTSLRRYRRVIRELEAQGPEGIAAAKEVQRRVVSGGQFGTTGAFADLVRSGDGRMTTAEHFASSKPLKGVGEAITDVGTAPVPKTLKKGYQAYTNWVFNTVNGRIEKIAKEAMAGKALKHGPLMEGSMLKTSNKAFADAADGLRNTSHQVELARQVQRAYGKYSKWGPDARDAITHSTPFIPWFINMTKFLGSVMPKDHPVLTSLAVSANLAEEDWRKKNRLSAYSDSAVPLFMRGSVPSTEFPDWAAAGPRDKDSFINLGRYGPALPGDVAGALGAQYMPQFGSGLLNLRGVDWTGEKLTSGEGKDATNARLAANALFSTLEATVPGVGPASRVTGFGDTIVRNKKSKETFVSGKKSLGTGVLEQFAPLRASGISSAKSGGKKKKKSSGSSMKMPTSGGTYKMPGGGGGFSMP